MKESQLPTLNHLGYLGILSINQKDRGRIYGSIAHEDTPNDIIMKNYFAGDNLKEVTERFIITVNDYIRLKEYNKRNRKWRETTDIKSIAAVYNILPKEFKALITSGKFDINLLHKVKGGHYEVPLYYATKAWDYILKSNMNDYEFLVGPYFYEDEKTNIEEWKVFIEENKPTRFRCQAIANNIEMKKIWKESFNIDIDSIDVDFMKFNRHLIDNVSENEYYDYFQDVPNGVYEYIFFPIIYPEKDYIFCDTISDLMETAANIKYWTDNSEDLCKNS